MDSGMVGSTRVTLLAISHDADVALVAEEVQSPFERRQAASRGGLSGVLYNRSMKILGALSCSDGETFSLWACTGWVHQRNEYLGH